MSDVLLYVVVFIVSLGVLVKASDFFTDAAEQIGLSIGLPPFIVGVTIVSVGTSLPELISSLIAVSQNSSEIVVGNVLGSNIANIFLIIGAATIIGSKGKAIQITYDLVNVDLPLFVGSAFLVGLEIWDGEFTKGEALLLVIGYLVYLFYTIKTSEDVEEEEDETSDSNEKKSSGFLARQVLVVIGSAIAIFLGANYTIDSIINISEILNIGKEIIAVTAVAFGTSLPELTVTINAASKGKAELAVGNVLGSNIFNTFMVMGIPGLIGVLVIPQTVIIGALPVMIAGTLLFFFATQDKELTIWEGWLFLLLYVWFVGKTFNLL